HIPSRPLNGFARPLPPTGECSKRSSRVIECVHPRGKTVARCSSILLASTRFHFFRDSTRPNACSLSLRAKCDARSARSFGCLSFVPLPCRPRTPQHSRASRVRRRASRANRPRQRLPLTVWFGTPVRGRPLVLFPLLS